MARRVFYSFHYKPDNWRVSKIRNIGAIEGNKPAADNDWESITASGDNAIQKWIDNQMAGRSCTIVLIGSGTAGRKWINYEIKKSWGDGKGLVGIYIHNITDKDGRQSNKGSNPFSEFTLNGTNLSNIVKAYDPPYIVSANVYNYIRENIVGWIEEAIKIRNGN